MPDVSIIFLDVGQGDATLVIDHDTGKALLIDCPSGGAQLAIDEIGTYEAELDTVIVTHSHLDHFGGVLSAVSALGCRRVLYNHDTLIAQPPVVIDGRTRSDPAVVATLRRLLEFTAEQVGPAVVGSAGVLGGASYSFLAPIHRDLTRGIVSRRANAASGVVLIEVGTFRVLIGGDADEETWQRLLRTGSVPEVLAARWPHHGADLNAQAPGLTDALLGQLNATVVAVSVGPANTYGHPSDTFLAATRADPCTVMCTGATAKCSPETPQACASTIRVRISDGVVTWNPTLDDHGQRVALLPTPRCLA